MRNNKKREEFKILMGKIGKKYPDIEFSFEAELEVKKLEEIVSLCNNFYVTYDTGNVTSCGFNHKEYINFFADRINNVHLKDRTFDAKTVKPMTGDTDFRLIFNILKNVGYNKPFILQTAREELGKERETMLQHKKIFEELYENGV
jgi:sugar phosphate isomerase/epimerase